MNANLANWTVEEYNADTTRLRSSHLRTILEPQGPRAFYLKHCVPQPEPEESSTVDEMDLGNLLHDLVLRKHVGWVTCDINKKAKEFKAFKAEHAGKVILTSKQEAKVMRWHEAVMRNAEVRKIVDAGYPELTGHLDYEVDVDGETEVIRCKCRWDLFCGDTGADWDIKTSRATDRRSFERQSTDLGYHVQAGFYELHKEGLGIYAAPHAFIAVLKSEPSWCYLWPVSHPLMEIGRSFAIQALQRIAECRVAERKLLADNPDADPIEAWPDYLELNQADAIQPDPWTATRLGTIEAEARGW